jgi:hypothetical protein
MVGMAIGSFRLIDRGLGPSSEWHAWAAVCVSGEDDRVIKLGDIELVACTAEVAMNIERDISLDRLALFFNRSWPGAGNVFLATPTGYRAWPPLPVKVGRTYWPTGATRYGISYQLATVDMVNSIHPAAFGGDGTQTNPQDLVLSSEAPDATLIERVTMVGMTVLPPVPLYAVLNTDSSTDRGMYLLICVSQRFYWNQYACPDFGISESGSVTWDDVLNELQTQLDITLDWPDIPAAYLQPSRALNLTGEPLDQVFEAVAANIGMKIIESYAGDISLQNFSDALDADTADFENFPNRTTRSGESRFADNL